MSDDHVAVNRASWDEDAPNWVERGRSAWASFEDPAWGWYTESELHLLPDVAGLDAVELGCGTGYISSWLARRGARVVGLDDSSKQLATAQLFQGEFGVRFPLVHADAERAPFGDASFDVAISEYGAAIWCDPYRWIPEAARILRPGGRLLFIAGGTLLMLCYPTDDDDAPAETTLHRPYFGMHRFEWHEAGDAVDAIEFHLGYGDMIRLLRSSGFEGRRPDRDPGAGRRGAERAAHPGRVGTTLAEPGGLEGPEGRLEDRSEGVRRSLSPSSLPSES